VARVAAEAKNCGCRAATFRSRRAFDAFDYRPIESARDALQGGGAGPLLLAEARALALSFVVLLVCSSVCRNDEREQRGAVAGAVSQCFLCR